MKKDNKGFSLIELIIVIAIMVIITAIVSGSYIKYVGRSKRAMDANNATEFAKACAVAHVFDTIETHAEAYIEGDVGWCGWTDGDIAHVNVASPSTVLDYLVQAAGDLPVSAVNRNFIWYLKYDVTTTEVLGIYITDDPATARDKYEVWPDGSDYIHNGPSH